MNAAHWGVSRKAAIHDTGTDRLNEIAGFAEPVWHCLTAAGKRFSRWMKSFPAAVKQWHTPKIMQARLE